MNIAYPSRIKFASGVSSNVLFLKGPQKWISSTISSIEKMKNTSKIKFATSSEESLTEWDINILLGCDAFAINFKGLDKSNLSLISMWRFAKFKPTVCVLDSSVDDICRVCCEVTSIPVLDQKALESSVVSPFVLYGLDAGV